MKIISFVLLFFLAEFSYTQTEQIINFSLSVDDYNILYVLDSAHYINESKNWYYKKKDAIRFLNIDNKDVFLYGGFKRRHVFYGEIDGLKVSLTENGEKVIYFYARGKEYQKGLVMSFDVVQITNHIYKIHYYNKFGLYKDVVFYAHIPDKKELDRIKESMKLIY